MGDLSEHFSAWEFRCMCGRAGAIDRRLLDMLERMRASKVRHRALTIVSGWRCQPCNRRVGGIRTSQHLVGRAADVPRGYGTVGQWAAAGAVGIGVRDGAVIHVDVTPGRKTFVFDD